MVPRLLGAGLGICKISGPRPGLGHAEDDDAGDAGDNEDDEEDVMIMMVVVAVVVDDNAAACDHTMSINGISTNQTPRSSCSYKRTGTVISHTGHSSTPQVTFNVLDTCAKPLQRLRVGARAEDPPQKAWTMGGTWKW